MLSYLIGESADFPEMGTMIVSDRRAVVDDTRQAADNLFSA